MLISPLGDNGAVLRGLLGMLVKKRTADTTDLLEISIERVTQFLVQYDIGITVDEVAGRYVIHVSRRQQHGQSLGICEGVPSTRDVLSGRAEETDIRIRDRQTS